MDTLGFPVVGGMVGHSPPILQFFLKPSPPTKSNAPHGVPPPLQLKNEAPPPIWKTNPPIETWNTFP